MDDEIQKAIESDRLIDITTIGRKSGKPHRIEIQFHYHDPHIYISGLPGTRDWYSNLLANPEFRFHLKQSIRADLPARAVPITEESARRDILKPIVARWRREDKLEVFVERSPLVEVFLN
ncbi:MAG: nitroreductase family deazaflavin-dependent oxidoreductase [Chloroflexi bacterium]|nr:nitroreductase family deazaflavin-dependent oxidoreductase [Chloroflexota bacterium]